MDDMSIVNRLTLKASSLIHNSKHSAVNSNIISAVRTGIREEEASDITVLEKNRVTNTNIEISLLQERTANEIDLWLIAIA